MSEKQENPFHSIFNSSAPQKGEDFRGKKYRSDIFFGVKEQLSGLDDDQKIAENMNNLVEAITQDLDADES